MVEISGSISAPIKTNVTERIYLTIIMAGNLFCQFLSKNITAHFPNDILAEARKLGLSLPRIEAMERYFQSLTATMLIAYLLYALTLRYNDTILERRTLCLSLL